LPWRTDWELLPPRLDPTAFWANILIYRWGKRTMDIDAELAEKQLDYEALVEARRLMAERARSPGDDIHRRRLERLDKLCLKQHSDIQAASMLPG
jgi:hypothetical protein